MSLATQSGRFQNSMQYHVAEMTKLASDAALLQASALADTTEANEEFSKATADKSESQVWRERASAKEAEAEALKASAVKDEEGAKSLNIKAGEEQVVADAAGVRAAADELVADEDESVAGEASASAARFEAEELNDGAAVVLCEFIPFVDVVCDVLGGVAEVSLATAATAEVAEAVAATSAAVAARNDESVAAKEVAESNIAATVDGEAAASLETTAEAEETESLADQEEATRDETEAQALQVEAKEAGAMAADEEMKAEAEEVDAGASLLKSAEHGLWAAQKAILSSAMGLLALSYFGVKLVARAFGFLTSMTAPATTNINQTRSCAPSRCLPQRFPQFMSYTTLHVLIFVSTTVSLLKHIRLHHIVDGSPDYTTQSKGGLLLIFGFVAATVQCCTLHILPDTLRSFYPVWEWIELFWFLLPLFIMEALIVFINLSRTSMGYMVLECTGLMSVWLIWICFFSCSVLYCWVFRPDGNVADHNEAEDKTESGDFELRITELTSLLESGQEDMASNSSLMKSSLTCSWNHLLFPLEVLILSILVPLLVSCTSHAKVLWPLLQHWVAGFIWAIPVVALAYLGLVAFVVWGSTRRTL